MWIDQSSIEQRFGTDLAAALAAFRSGRSVFITGGRGQGKSTLLKALVDRVRNGCSPITLNLPHDFDAFLLTAYRLAAEQAQISEAGGLAHFQDLLEAGRTDGWEPLFSPLLSPAGEDRPLFVFDNLEVLSLHTF